MSPAAGAGIAALSILISGMAAPGGARAAPATPVGLLTSVEGRVARQLRRELSTSGFMVVKVAGASGPAPRWLVAMDPERTQVLLLVDAPGADDPPPLARFTIDVHDEVSIRRAALALVERLRLETSDRPVDHRPLASAPSVAAAATPPPSPPASMLAAPAPPMAASPPRPRPWSLAAATAFDFPAHAGRPLGHVQIVGETPLGATLVGRLRVLWPLLGRTERLPDRAVRLWTMGAAFGLRLPLYRTQAPGPGPAGLPPRWQPFVAAATGLRLVLSDTDWFDYRHGDVGLTPALAATVSAGLRLALGPLVQVVLELGSEWSRTLPSFSPAPHARDAADAHALRVALGLSFDY